MQLAHVMSWLSVFRQVWPRLVMSQVYECKKVDKLLAIALFHFHSHSRSHFRPRTSASAITCAKPIRANLAHSVLD